MSDLRDARVKLFATVVGAAVVWGIAIGLYGVGPRWGEATRWFSAGLMTAALIVSIVAYRMSRRNARREALLDAETQRVARQFAEAVEAELAKRGIEGEMAIRPRTGPGSVH